MAKIRANEIHSVRQKYQAFFSLISDQMVLKDNTYSILIHGLDSV